ncbi:MULTISPECIES: hypothetical protein [unclassified Rhodococcus (in: high G+C Gram-positive bacteria)]|uniref:hypothetical protein n=1 Tax=unclassified Rhodococcus (in: high G+C Gram-positive bacteria) TaxID=192944 RepID=UPI0024B7DED6|nr:MULTISPECIES: hypothetical protein [unclassified Rhodococcus (in: high G+C Gram-positive bacteria)]MDI9960825.1 hypothetical protein [Rhodococcus sp. IEGM 1237]MDI9966841.1 hypothetical protein [Rhodococcus sp. IEGM 1251]MDV8129324.1 hypothetical protein [Rhodococcus sp. IEGM 1304]
MFWWQSLIIAASTGTISAISTLLAIKFTNSAGDERLKNQLTAENARATESHAHDRRLRADEARSQFQRHINDRIIEITSSLIAMAETYSNLYEDTSFNLVLAANAPGLSGSPESLAKLANFHIEAANRSFTRLAEMPFEMKLASSELRLIAPGLVEASARELVEVAESMYPNGDRSIDLKRREDLAKAIDKLVRATRAYVEL